MKSKYNNLKYSPKGPNQTRDQEEQEDLTHDKNGKAFYYDILKRKRSKTLYRKKVKQNKNIDNNRT